MYLFKGTHKQQSRNLFLGVPIPIATHTQMTCWCSVGNDAVCWNEPQGDCLRNDNGDGFSRGHSFLIPCISCTSKMTSSAEEHDGDQGHGLTHLDTVLCTAFAQNWSGRSRHVVLRGTSEMAMACPFFEARRLFWDWFKPPMLGGLPHVQSFSDKSRRKPPLSFLSVLFSGWDCINHLFLGGGALF